MSRIVWILILLLLILHQDNWFWNDGQLVFGFMPIGLFYHACIISRGSSRLVVGSEVLLAGSGWITCLKSKPQRRTMAHDPVGDYLWISVALLLSLGMWAGRLFTGTRSDYVVASRSIGPFSAVDVAVRHNDDRLRFGRLLG